MHWVETARPTSRRTLAKRRQHEPAIHAMTISTAVIVALTKICLSESVEIASQGWIMRKYLEKYYKEDTSVVVLELLGT